MDTKKFNMKQVLEKITQAQEVYDKKFESVIKTLATMEVTDEKFNKLMDTCSSLISLNLQTVKVFEDYNHQEEQRKINESMRAAQKVEGGNK